MTGYEELDFHGEWIPDANYGNVWVPRVVPTGWAPYRDGQWRWVRPWGWTWVDHAPWGYAPFHYGRWVTIGNRWCWWPGGHHVRPVWAPALVGFVGGSNLSVSVGFGGPVVGWYPLAPWHHYRPHYRHNPRYVTVINQTIINNPPRGVPPHRNHEGATMVPGPRFRDPVMKVALPVRTNIAELQTVAPPPKNIAPVRRVADDNVMVRRPNQVQPSPQASAPAPASVGRPVPAPSMVPSPARCTVRSRPSPTRVAPPIVAEPIPNRGVKAQPALPGNDPAPLAQPPKFNRVPPTQIQTAPVPPRAEPDMVRPQPRARMPQENLPQSSTESARGSRRTGTLPAGCATDHQAAQGAGAAVAHTAPPAPQPVQRVAPPSLPPIQRASPDAPPVQRAAPPSPPPVQRAAPDAPQAPRAAPPSPLPVPRAAPDAPQVQRGAPSAAAQPAPRAEPRHREAARELPRSKQL